MFYLLPLKKELPGNSPAKKFPYHAALIRIIASGDAGFEKPHDC
jgi:hypothetical protein